MEKTVAVVEALWESVQSLWHRKSWEWYNLDTNTFSGGCLMVGGDVVFQLIMLLMIAGFVLAAVLVVRSIMKGNQKRSQEEERLSSIEDKLDDVMVAIDKKKPE